MFSFSNIWDFVSSIFFTTEKIRFHFYLSLNKIFFTINFIAVGFVLSDLNSNPSNLTEVLLVSVALVDLLTCLNISLIPLKISKSSLSGSITKNLKPSSCFIAACLFIPSRYFCCYVNFHQFLLWAYINENTSQSHNLTHYIFLVYFFLQINELLLLALTVLLLRGHHIVWILIFF